MDRKRSQLTLNFWLSGSDMQQYMAWKNDDVTWTIGGDDNGNGLTVHPGLGENLKLTGTARVNFNTLFFGPWPEKASFSWIQSVLVPEALTILKLDILIPGGKLNLITDAGHVLVIQPPEQKCAEPYSVAIQ